MDNFEEIKRQKSVVVRNILSTIHLPGSDGIPVYSEADFDKAQKEGSIEVFEVEKVSQFKINLEKAIATANGDPTLLGMIEKATKDISKLVKVKKQDSKGRMMTYYVKANKSDGDKVGKQMSATEVGKHYVVHLHDGTQLVVKRAGHNATGAPTFHTVDENGKPQGEPQHFQHSGISHVEPHAEMDKKVSTEASDKKKKFQEGIKKMGSGDKVDKIFKYLKENRMTATDRELNEVAEAHDMILTPKEKTAILELFESDKGNDKKKTSKDASFYDGWDEEDLKESISSYEKQLKDYNSSDQKLPKSLQDRKPEHEAMKANLKSRK